MPLSLSRATLVVPVSAPRRPASRPLLRAAPCAALLLVHGCVAAGEPSLEVGSATEDDGVPTFMPLAGGEDVLVTLGPQGGYHVLGSVRVTGIEEGTAGDLGDARNPTTTFALDDENGQTLGEVSATQGLAAVADAPGTYELLARRVILEITDDDDIVGQDALLRTTVTDVNGVELRAEVSIHLVADPNNF